ncbi:homeodomain-interacting protein kinase 2-like [Cheilinus undulatus]|uniref:homeodomain-interacting protein kinase 2-like n=1 Tax=Cheilinus undulatus TaxID=241271 RepID=UPI001BD4B09C|nr:homeodomain-interacting protein kinase 2-like [Cheilinus undulatus]
MAANRKFNLKRLVQGPGDGKSPHQLPDDYEFLEVVGEGSYGKVLRCFCKDTKSKVAIKIPTRPFYSKPELAILEKLMAEGLDQHNIIACHGSYQTSHGTALVFENLDLSLQEHIIKDRCKRMPLSDIRAVISQMAVALKALRSSKVIHTDIKLDNIMFVDQTQPLRAKLIDFGLAMRSSSVRPGMMAQAVCYRAPEVFLGLPFTEAIDMWALGCVLFTMLFRRLLIETPDETETMNLLVDMLGQPPDELLDKGRYTGKFFTKTSSGRWKIKEKKFRAGSNDDPEEYQQCIQLLTAMLTMCESQRITPQEVLQHPFITQTSQCILNKTYSTKIHQSISHHRQAPTIPQSTEINVRPLAAQSVEIHGKKKKQEDTKKSPPVPPSGVIMVQPARAENTCQLEGGDEDRPPLRKEVSVQPINKHKQRSSTSKKQFQHPSPIIRTKVIAVRPATPENTQELDDKDSELQKDRPPLRKEVPVRPTNKHKRRSFTSRDGPKKQFQQPNPVLRTKVIAVQPATPENTQELEDEDSKVQKDRPPLKKEDRLRLTEGEGLKQKEEEREGSLNTEDKKTPLPPEDGEEKKKKKKSRWQRFCSWMKKKIFCRAVDVL